MDKDSFSYLPKLHNPHFNFVTLSLNDAEMAKEY